MKKNLIMLNMSHQFEWDKGMVNRNFQVLQELIDRHAFEQILSVDFQPFTLKKKLKVFLLGRPWRKTANTVYYRMTTRVDQDAKQSSLYHLTSYSLKRLPDVMKKLKMKEEETIIWSYNPMVAKEMTAFPKATIVFDAVDNWTEHSSFPAYKETLQENYKLIQREADVIFTVSEGLIDLFERQPNVFYIPNGVKAQDFLEAACKKDLLPKALRAKKQPIIGYHGIIQSRINFSIISYLAEKHPKWQFVIIGPVWKEVEQEMRTLKKFPNVFSVPFVPYEQLPAIISCFDAAMIPHKVDTFTQSMNPLKMYEYLAAGKPIVSTPIAGADQLQDLITLAVSPEDFSTKLEHALEHDTEKLRERRRTMAKQYSWKQRVDIMLDIVERHLEK